MPRPAPTPSVGLEPIATLPVFFKLRGLPALLAGGGPPAVWKAELLAAAGAEVRVVAEEPCAELDMLAAGSEGRIVITRRAWTEADLAGVAMALGAIEDDEEAAHFRAAARGAGVPVNVIDKPAFCDFQFGTVVSRSPLVIGISTDGAAPVFGQAIRARIEALLPAGLKAWAEAARDWRPAVQARGFDFRGRRRFWEVFAERALESTSLSPGEEDRRACHAAAEAAAEDVGTPMLTLVGAGRGTADGITLRAIKALQDADIVFFGPEVAPTLVNFARREAPKLQVVPGPAEAEVAFVRQHGNLRRHVWLDTGNPLTCQRWRDRAGALPAAEMRLTPPVEGLGRCAACTPACPGWLSA